jgi:hypothetical protein
MFNSRQDITLSTINTFNERAGCTVPIVNRTSVCDENDGCGDNDRCRQEHHRSGNHFLRVNQGDRNMSIFKFVNFPICSYRGDGDHIPVNGLAFMLGDTTLTTSRSDNPERTTAHEISHLFGAEDNTATTTVCSSPECVMTRGASTYDEWCEIHIEQILAGRHLR